MKMHDCKNLSCCSNKHACKLQLYSIITYTIAYTYSMIPIPILMYVYINWSAFVCRIKHKSKMRSLASYWQSIFSNDHRLKVVRIVASYISKRYCNVACMQCVHSNPKSKLPLLCFITRRHSEVGPVYVFWALHTPRIVTTDPDHVKVIVMFMVSPHTKSWRSNFYALTVDLLIVHNFFWSFRVITIYIELS